MGLQLGPVWNTGIQNIQEYEKLRNYVGMHLQNRGLENIGALKERLFGNTVGKKCTNLIKRFETPFGA